MVHCNNEKKLKLAQVGENFNIDLCNNEKKLKLVIS